MMMMTTRDDDDDDDDDCPRMMSGVRFGAPRSFSDAALAFCAGVLCMAITSYDTVVRGRNSRRLAPFFHLLSWGLPLVLTVAPVFTHSYGLAGAWCWIKNATVWDDVWRFAQFYVPVWSIEIVVIVLYALVLHHIRTVMLHVRGDPGASKTRHGSAVELRLGLYCVGLLFSYVFPTVNRIQNWVAPESPVFALYMLHVLTAASAGVWNAVVYGSDPRIRSAVAPTCFGVCLSRCCACACCCGCCCRRRARSAYLSDYESAGDERSALYVADPATRARFRVSVAADADLAAIFSRAELANSLRSGTSSINAEPDELSPARSETVGLIGRPGPFYNAAASANPFAVTHDGAAAGSGAEFSRTSSTNSLGTAAIAMFSAPRAIVPAEYARHHAATAAAGSTSGRSAAAEAPRTPASQAPPVAGPMSQAAGASTTRSTAGSSAAGESSAPGSRYTSQTSGRSAAAGPSAPMTPSSIAAIGASSRASTLSRRQQRNVRATTTSMSGFVRLQDPDLLAAHAPAAPAVTSSSTAQQEHQQQQQQQPLTKPQIPPLFDMGVRAPPHSQDHDDTDLPQ